jgi:hypothetical protein
MSRTHRRTDDDDDADLRKVLKDGEHLVVSLTMMDGLQRDVAQHFARVSDGTDNAVGLNKPGPRFSDQRRDMSAYDAYDESLTTAFRDKPKAPPTAGGQMVGDICTVRSGGGAFGPEGSPGHLQMIKGALVCVADPEFRQPNNAASSDALPLKDERDAAYRAYDQDLQQAYRSWR